MYREMNTSGFAEVVKGRLLPNWVAFNLVNSRWNFCNFKQILKLLCWEIAHTNGSCLPRCIQPLHCVPRFRYAQRLHHFWSEPSGSMFRPKRPMYLYNKHGYVSTFHWLLRIRGRKKMRIEYKRYVYTR